MASTASPVSIEKGSAAEEQPTFVERWLIMPKALYFMLNMFVYAFHGIIMFIFHDDWKWPWWLFGFATSITAFNFVGSLIWGPLADRTGKYKTIIGTTAILYTICACLLVVPTEFKVGWVNTVWAMVLLALFNFFLSAPFPLIDSQVMGLLASRPYYSRSQFGNQRMYGCIGHWIATIIIFSLKEYGKAKGKVWGVDNPLLKHADRYFLAGFQVLITAVFLAIVFFAVPDVKPVKAGHHGAHGGHKKKTVHPAAVPASPASTTTGVSVTITDAGSSSASLAGLPVGQVPLEKAMPFAPTPAPPCAAAELTEAANAPGHPVVRLLTNGNFLFLMAFICCAGVVRSVTGGFTKVITFKATKGDMIMTAFTEGTRVISEISIYLMAGWLKQLMGVHWILVLSQIFGILRLVGYGVVPLGSGSSSTLATAFIFGLELLKGFGSGLISSSAIAIANDIAPEGCEATAQGLYSGMYSGLSTLVGGVMSGMYLWFIKTERPVVPKDATPEVRDAAIEAWNLAQAEQVQSLFIFVTVVTTIVTAAMAAKYIFVDRVMGLPGFPRRRSSLAQ